MKTKKEIRKECRNVRMALSAEQVEERSKKAGKHLLSSALYQDAEVILAYIDTQNEISTKPILQDAWQSGKTVAVPRVDGKNMDFYLIDSYEDLEEGAFGVFEPKESCPIYEGGAALLLLPGVAFDAAGGRVGYGGGFYDRYLEKHPEHKKVGYAYQFQIYSVVPREATDIPVDALLTEEGLFSLPMLTLQEENPEQESMRQSAFIEKCREIVQEKEKKNGKKLACHIATIGYQINARDSEKLLGILRNIGYEETDSEDADFVLYNTCTVRENANQRVYGRLGHLNSLKRQHPQMIVALCGCMVQEDVVVEKIRSSYSFVDLLFGTHNIFKLAELLYRCLTEEGMVVDIWEDTKQIVEDLPVERKYSFKSGVNIMFGCNNFCTYCIVPYVRGRERSRKPEDIVREIESLVADGVVEVMLLGQNVNSYGKNLENPISFAELLHRIEAIPGLERIRFMTSHPKDLSDELIEVMASSEKICRHLHLPLQSGSSRLLKKMNRSYNKEQYLELVKKIRTAMPDISLTTDIIVGFPGETEEDFEETMDVVAQVRYDSAFTFIYSPRTGTPAAAMPDQIPAKVTKPRFDRLLALVQEIAAQQCGRDEGKVMDALVEGMDDHNPEMVTGRLGNNIMVHFPGDANLLGKIVPVRLKQAHGFYYIGERE